MERRRGRRDLTNGPVTKVFAVYARRREDEWNGRGSNHMLDIDVTATPILCARSQSSSPGLAAHKLTDIADRCYRERFEDAFVDRLPDRRERSLGREKLFQWPVVEQARRTMMQRARDHRGEPATTVSEQVPSVCPVVSWTCNADQRAHSWLTALENSSHGQQLPRR